MKYFFFVRPNTIHYKKRRGLSQIMGAILMMAIVVPIGTVILFNGATEINAFNNSMATTVDYQNNGIQEDLEFQHVRFIPNSNVVEISVINTGSVPTLIDRITLVNMSSQAILFKIDGLSTFTPEMLSIKGSTTISIEPTLEGVTNWEDGGTPTVWDYKISIITSRGNFFDTVARPYNT